MVLSAPTYRGRPVNTDNIQEFVSELVTKYIPSDIPQWQVIVIPTAAKVAALDTQEISDADTVSIQIKIQELFIY